ncbi:hypothetical protein [Euryhalocaulis caribicus]|uniref:hypothetical protein n=1 Tax=Euryhalocaulis caribicus TaxID=1161401 RepID=UPI00039D04DB|nr:hypothetical protein [Euryhalocaulis caribicus]
MTSEDIDWFDCRFIDLLAEGIPSSICFAELCARQRIANLSRADEFEKPTMEEADQATTGEAA